MLCPPRTIKAKKQSLCLLNKIFLHLFTNVHCLRPLSLQRSNMDNAARLHNPSRIAPPNGEYPIFLPPAPAPLRRGQQRRWQWRTEGEGREGGRWHARRSVGKSLMMESDYLPFLHSLLALPPRPPSLLPSVAGRAHLRIACCCCCCRRPSSPPSTSNCRIRSKCSQQKENKRESAFRRREIRETRLLPPRQAQNDGRTAWGPAARGFVT